jgi:hypothetical protein
MALGKGTLCVRPLVMPSNDQPPASGRRAAQSTLALFFEQLFIQMTEHMKYLLCCLPNEPATASNDLTCHLIAVAFSCSRQSDTAR